MWFWFQFLGVFLDFMKELISIIKYSVIFISNFYGYLKLSNKKPRVKNLLDILISVIFGTLLYYTTKKLRLLIPLLIILLTILYNLTRKTNVLLNTVILSIISYGITIFIFVIASIFSLPLGAVYYNLISNEFFCNIIMMISLNFIQLVLIWVLFKIKRFKSGISLYIKDGNTELLLLTSIFAIFLMTLFYTKDVALSPTEIIILSITFCGLALIIWWRKHITNTYQKQLYKRNEAFYEERIKDYEKERTELIKQNEELSKIIHRDNKLIPALVGAVQDIVAKFGSSDELVNLLNQLESLSCEHKELIEHYQTESDNLLKTSSLSVNAVIRFLYAKATKSNIDMLFEIDDKAISLLIEKVSDITELSTILCDLGENAIIATKNLKLGQILVTSELIDNHTPCISFFDNGNFFEECVIANMGMKKITTHKADGGSGIGLMTLFELLHKYKASYCLNECPRKDGFTKSISIIFDDLYKISIITERDNIKSICSSRSDFFTNYTKK